MMIWQVYGFDLPETKRGGSYLESRVGLRSDVESGSEKVSFKTESTQTGSFSGDNENEGFFVNVYSYASPSSSSASGYSSQTQKGDGYTQSALAEGSESAVTNVSGYRSGSTTLSNGGEGGPATNKYGESYQATTIEASEFSQSTSSMYSFSSESSAQGDLYGYTEGGSFTSFSSLMISRSSSYSYSSSWRSTTKNFSSQTTFEGSFTNSTSETFTTSFEASYVTITSTSSSFSISPLTFRTTQNSTTTVQVLGWESFTVSGTYINTTRTINNAISIVLDGVSMYTTSTDFSISSRSVSSRRYKTESVTSTTVAFSTFSVRRENKFLDMVVGKSPCLRLFSYFLDVSSSSRTYQTYSISTYTSSTHSIATFTVSLSQYSSSGTSYSYYPTFTSFTSYVETVGSTTVYSYEEPAERDNTLLGWGLPFCTDYLPNEINEYTIVSPDFDSTQNDTSDTYTEDSQSSTSYVTDTVYTYSEMGITSTFKSEINLVGQTLYNSVSASSESIPTYSSNTNYTRLYFSEIPCRIHYDLNRLNN